MPGQNYGGGSYGQTDSSSESTAVLRASAQTITTSSTVAAPTISSTSQASAVGMSATATAGVTNATSVWEDDSADGPVAETEPNTGTGYRQIEDVAGDGPTAISESGSSVDGITIADDAIGPIAETTPGYGHGTIRSPIVSTVAPATQISERKRLESYLKTPFKSPEDEWGDASKESDFGSLVQVLAEAGQDHATVRDQLVYSRYVDTAVGQPLENIGAGVLVDRQRNASGDIETDEHYRLRIKAQLRRLLGGGRIIEIRRGVASLLGVAIGAIRVHENFANEKAAFTIEITSRMLEQSDTPLEYVVEFIDLIDSGGVDANVILRGEFRHRDKDAAPNALHGYNNAGYTGDITDY